MLGGCGSRGRPVPDGHDVTEPRQSEQAGALRSRLPAGGIRDEDVGGRGNTMSGRYNWDARSHRRLYDDIHGNGGFFGADGAGVSGAQGSQEGWAELAALMARARERTEAALSNAGAIWEGGAADAMRSGITPLAQWAADAHIASIASQQSTDRHVDAYSSAKHWMPEPVPVTSTANSDGL